MEDDGIVKLRTCLHPGGNRIHCLPWNYELTLAGRVFSSSQIRRCDRNSEIAKSKTSKVGHLTEHQIEPRRKL